MNDSWIKRVWHRIFGLDLRSLALFRMAMGILLVADVLMRWQCLDAFYTDSGIASRQMVSEFNQAVLGDNARYSWSINNLSGSRELQTVLFGLTIAAALMMAAGFQTRIATVVSWVLLVSMHARDPLVNHSGDTIFRIALFWAMFLPLGAVWSLDARRRVARTSAAIRGMEVASPATAGLIGGLFSMYFFAGIAKLNDVWYSGDAMQYIAGMDLYMYAAGRRLPDYPALMKFITWWTLIVEVPIALMLFSPWRNRGLRLILFCLFIPFHIGIASTMLLGTFQYVAMAIWLALLPGFVYGLAGRGTARQTADVASAVQKSPYRGLSILTNAITAFLFVYFLVWHISDIRQLPSLKKLMPQAARVPGCALNLQQQFHMFDNPAAFNPWFVFDARLTDGTSVDILRNEAVSYHRPDSVIKTIPTHHWRMFMRILLLEDPVFHPFRKSLARYLVRQWNEAHGPDKQVELLKLVVVLEEIRPKPGEVPAEQKMLLARIRGDGEEASVFEETLKDLESGDDFLPY